MGRRTFSKQYIFDENAPRTKRYLVRGLRKQLRYTEEDMAFALYMSLALYQSGYFRQKNQATSQKTVV